jgi:hypothetical protein
MWSGRKPDKAADMPSSERSRPAAVRVAPPPRPVILGRGAAKHLDIATLPGTQGGILGGIEMGSATATPPMGGWLGQLPMTRLLPPAFPTTMTLGRGGIVSSGQMLEGLSRVLPSPGGWIATNSA